MTASEPATPAIPLGRSLPWRALRARVAARPATLVVASSIALGAVLRLAFLGQQVVIGDEIHAIGAAQSRTLGWILTHYQRADHCIPISALGRLLERTVGLEEWGLRLLAFLPGIALLALAERAARPLMDGAERALLVLLLATSPLLVFWSRLGRPYAAIVLLGLLAVLAAARHARKGRARWVLAGGAAQAALFWFSPTSLPFLGALAAATALDGALFDARGARAPARLRRAAFRLQPSLAGMLLAYVLVGLALPSLFSVLAAKSGVGVRAGLGTWLDGARLVFGFPALLPGSRAWLLVLVPAGLALAGCARLWREHPRLALAGAIVLLLPAIAWSTREILAIDRGRVLVRYQAAALPFVFALVAYGAGGLWRALAARSRPLARAAVAATFAAAGVLALAGPLRDGLPPNRPHGLFYSRLVLPRRGLEVADPALVPAFYRGLGPRDVVVEWSLRPDHVWLHALLATQHPARVLRSQGFGGPERSSFRTYFDGIEATLRGMPQGAYLVLHPRANAERKMLASGRAPAGARGATNSPGLARLRRQSQARLGAAVYADEWIEVYRKGAAP